MNPEEAKRKSRGISQDMSPEAISKRLEIASQLLEVANWLKKIRKIEPADAGDGKSDPPGSGPEVKKR